MAVAMNRGKGVPQSTIQCMGTPRSQFSARFSAKRRDFGLRWTKRAFSRASIASTEAAAMGGMMLLGGIDDAGVS